MPTILSQIGMAALAFFLVLWVVMAAAICAREGFAALRDLFHWAKRFRLRTLFLVFTISQVLLAGCVVLHRGSVSFELVLGSFAFGCLLMVGWFVWCVLADALRPTASRRFKALLRSTDVGPIESETQQSPGGPPATESAGEGKA